MMENTLSAKTQEQSPVSQRVCLKPLLSCPVPPPPTSKRSIPEQAMGYFIANAARMRYLVFRA